MEFNNIENLSEKEIYEAYNTIIEAPSLIASEPCWSECQCGCYYAGCSSLGFSNGGLCVTGCKPCK